MNLSQSIILIVTSFISSLASLLTLIGLTTPKWLIKHSRGLWNCNGTCSSSTAALTILAFLLLVTSTIFLIVLLSNLLPQYLRILPLCFMVLGTLFLLSATSSYLRRFNKIGYSFELVVAAHAFAFLGSVLLAFWYGTTINDDKQSSTTV